MEPDFGSASARSLTSTRRPHSALVLHPITGSQVLARPSEWLELLRRYGNVAPFFSPVWPVSSPTGRYGFPTSRHCSNSCHQFSRFPGRMNNNWRTTHRIMRETQECFSTSFRLQLQATTAQVQIRRARFSGDHGANSRHIDEMAVLQERVVPCLLRDFVIRIRSAGVNGQRHDFTCLANRSFAR
jgi:hypothetical protein